MSSAIRANSGNWPPSPGNGACNGSKTPPRRWARPWTAGLSATAGTPPSSASMATKSSPPAAAAQSRPTDRRGIPPGAGAPVPTNDEEGSQRLKHLTTAAKPPHAWAFLHDQVGYNYRMPNLNAALGCAQLEQAPRFLAAKRALAAAYARAFAGLGGLRILPSPPGTESNYWLVTLLADSADQAWLDATLQAL